MLYKIFFTTKFIKPQFDGQTYGPFIFIRPEFYDDIGLIEHEKTHVRQFWRTFCLHPIISLFSKSYRLKSEVEAYRVQLNYTSPSLVDLFAYYLSEKYEFDLSQVDAKGLLTE